MLQKFDYDDINLIPRYSVVDSRSECDTSIQLGDFKFKNPVIPANMEAVISEELAIKLAENGYFYIMHRFGTDNVKFIKKMKSLNLVTSISIGVNDESYQLIEELIKKDIIPDFITVDIAHGHCKKMKKMLKFLKDKKLNSFIIAGNVASIEATRDLDNWGADAIKVGIAPGCFVPNANIITKEGIKNLKDIEVNDYVLTHKNKFEKVLQVHTYEEKHELIKINDLPPCSETHEFYVINKSEKYLINENNINEFAYWVKADDLNREKHLLVKFPAEFIEIEKIERINYNGEVMDLTIENDESYNIEGIIVHNSACTTSPTTGFGSRNIQASVVYECSKSTEKYIIADGGIKTPADITKSIVLGASMVMVGGMLSSFIDSPGRTIEIDGIKHKEFYGSASARQGSKKSRIEGTVKLNKLKSATMTEYLEYLTECLQSSISYGGGKCLKDLYSVRWI